MNNTELANKLRAAADVDPNLLSVQAVQDLCRKAAAAIETQGFLSFKGTQVMGNGGHASLPTGTIATESHITIPVDYDGSTFARVVFVRDKRPEKLIEGLQSISFPETYQNNILTEYVFQVDVPAMIEHAKGAKG